MLHHELSRLIFWLPSTLQPWSHKINGSRAQSQTASLQQSLWKESRDAMVLQSQAGRLETQKQAWGRLLPPDLETNKEQTEEHKLLWTKYLKNPKLHLFHQCLCFQQQLCTSAHWQQPTLMLLLILFDYRKKFFIFSTFPRQMFFFQALDKMTACKNLAYEHQVLVQFSCIIIS